MHLARRKFSDSEGGVFAAALSATGVRFVESDRTVVAALFPSGAALENRPVQRAEPTSAEPLDGCVWRAARGAAKTELDFRLSDRAPAQRWPAISSGKEAFQPFGPNQTLEPTRMLGTSPAEQARVPSIRVAHL